MLVSNLSPDVKKTAFIESLKNSAVKTIAKTLINGYIPSKVTPHHNFTFEERTKDAFLEKLGLDKDARSMHAYQRKEEVSMISVARHSDNNSRKINEKTLIALDSIGVEFDIKKWLSANPAEMERLYKSIPDTVIMDRAVPGTSRVEKQTISKDDYLGDKEHKNYSLNLTILASSYCKYLNDGSFTAGWFTALDNFYLHIKNELKTSMLRNHTPRAVNFSGYGFHFWYVLDNLVEVHTPSAYSEDPSTFVSFAQVQKFITRLSLEVPSLDKDAADIFARYLRVPGNDNVKNPHYPVPCMTVVTTTATLPLLSLINEAEITHEDWTPGSTNDLRKSVLEPTPALPIEQASVEVTTTNITWALYQRLDIVQIYTDYRDFTDPDEAGTPLNTQKKVLCPLHYHFKRTSSLKLLLAGKKGTKEYKHDLLMSYSDTTNEAIAKRINIPAKDKKFVRPFSQMMIGIMLAIMKKKPDDYIKVEEIPTCYEAQDESAISIAEAILVDDAFKKCEVYKADGIDEHIIYSHSLRCPGLWEVSTDYITLAIDKIALGRKIAVDGKTYIPSNTKVEEIVKAVLRILRRRNLDAMNKCVPIPFLRPVPGMSCANGYLEIDPVTNESKFLTDTSDMHSRNITVERHLSNFTYNPELTSLDALVTLAPNFHSWWTTSVNLPWGKEDMLAFLQYLGYALRGQAFDIGKCGYIFLGARGIGKSTFLDALRYKLGATNCGASKLHLMNENKNLASFFQKPFIIVGDLPGALIKHPDELKSLFHGEQINYNRLYKEAHTAVCRASYIAATNHFPTFQSDDSSALYDRFRFIRCTGVNRREIECSVPSEVTDTTIDSVPFVNLLSAEMDHVLSFALNYANPFATSRKPIPMTKHSNMIIRTSGEGEDTRSPEEENFEAKIERQLTTLFVQDTKGVLSKTLFDAYSDAVGEANPFTSSNKFTSLMKKFFPGTDYKGTGNKQLFKVRPRTADEINQLNTNKAAQKAVMQSITLK